MDLVNDYNKSGPEVVENGEQTVEHADLIYNTTMNTYVSSAEQLSIPLNSLRRGRMSSIFISFNRLPTDVMVCFDRRARSHEADAFDDVGVERAL